MKKIKKYFCKEPGCNNEICYDTIKRGQGRCRSCANIGKNNPMFNKKHTNKILKKKRAKFGYDKIFIKKYLTKQYIIKKISINKLAKLHNCSTITIYKYLKYHKIKIRSRSNAQSIRKDRPKRRKYYCKTCEKQICYNSFHRGSELCRSCSNSVSMKNFLKDPHNHPNYIEDKIRNYPINFNNSLKELIRNRDNRKCQICGCPEIECDKKLDVHHIDYNKENYDKNNLISLCHRCHMKTNANRNYWEDYFTSKIKTRNK